MSALTPIHRRIWRLAFLLSGNADAASSLIGRIGQLHKSPASLEPALLDRIIIQSARSLPKSINLPARQPGQHQGQPDASPARIAHAAALRLSHQPFEAWVLRRLDDLDELHMARAMDCSKTAARTHLAAADEALAARLGDQLPASIAALRKFADSLDPAPFILDYQERTRRARSKKRKITAIIIAAAALLLAFILLQLIVSGTI